jgi:streptogramin lyase
MTVRRLLLALVLATVGLSATAVAAGGGPKFSLHKARPVTADGIAPDTITAGPDHNLWFVENGLNVGRLNPRNGSVKSFHVRGVPAFVSLGGITSGPGNFVWLAAGSTIERITPGSGAMKAYKLTSLAEARALIKGPDGNLWFTDGGGPGSIGRLNPSTGAVSEFADPGGQPDGITVGPDHNIWFTDGNGIIGKVIPATGVVTQTQLPTSNCNSGSQGPMAWAIVPGPLHDLWFTTYITDEVGRINPATNKVKEYCVKRGTDNEFSIGIAVSRSGKVWFTTESISDAIGQLGTSSGKITRYKLPGVLDGGGPGLVLGPDHNLWVTLPNAKKIARVH